MPLTSMAWNADLCYLLDKFGAKCFSWSFRLMEMYDECVTHLLIIRPRKYLKIQL